MVAEDGDLIKGTLAHVEQILSVSTWVGSLVTTCLPQATSIVQDNAPIP